ncbi:uncharacterized protein UTRI_06516 [Ustilago trichophora]|uniref:Secreted protein n=1 Tax=Ustilago trichophora TaxID=86804 RepID=A0A5C3ENU6_9BASI|nr:uncharacterized protein UTRI_06516 [Ustilago trichophora]
MHILSPLLFKLIAILLTLSSSILALGPPTEDRTRSRASLEIPRVSQTSQRTEYTDAAEHLSTPPTPPTVPLEHLDGDVLVPSRVIYPDEDADLSRLAWFHGLAEQKAAGGKWKYIEHPLQHPSDGWGSSGLAAKTPGGAVESEAPAPFVFGAQGGGGSVARQDKGLTGENEVPVEKVHLLPEGGEAGRNEDLLRSHVPGDGLRRRRGRFNEALGGGGGTGGSRRGIRSHRTPPVPLSPSSFRKDQAGTSAQFGERAHSPTRWALEEARSKLDKLSPGSRARAERELQLQLEHQNEQSQSQPQQRLPGEGEGWYSSRSPPLSATSSSGYASVDGHYGSTAVRTPSSAISSAGGGVRQGYPLSQLTPPSPPLAQQPPFSSDPAFKPQQPTSVAPYRVWSVKEGLKSINLGEATKLTDRYPSDHRHFQDTTSALFAQEWRSKMSNRLRWAGEHRIDTSQPARVVTPLGAVLGSDVGMSTPRFRDDPQNPMPDLESIVATEKDKKINSWGELASIVPPALTGHSTSVYEAHNEASGYKGIKKEFRDALHPIQYITQLLKDQNGAVVFENSISSTIHKDLQNTPPEALAKLRALRAKEKAAATKEAKGKSKLKSHPEELAKSKSGATETSIEDLLGTEYATHNRFFYEYYHIMDAFKLKNPLDTPLEDFAAFRPYAKALALRDHPL